MNETPHFTHNHLCALTVTVLCVANIMMPPLAASLTHTLLHWSKNVEQHDYNPTQRCARKNGLTSLAYPKKYPSSVLENAIQTLNAFLVQYTHTPSIVTWGNDLTSYTEIAYHIPRRSSHGHLSPYRVSDLRAPFLFYCDRIYCVSRSYYPNATHQLSTISGSRECQTSGQML